VKLPTGDNWHVDLFKRFCDPPQEPLPTQCDAALAARLGTFRKFRHVVHHGYGFQLEWDRMREGLEQVGPILLEFREHVAAHVNVV
jgi:hypothetical protein